MAATATTSTRTPPPSGRSANYASRTASTIAKGATARSAVASPKGSTSLNSSRRPSVRSPPPPDHAIPPEGLLHLEAALKRETEEKETLLLRVQNMEDTISTLIKEGDNVKLILSAAEEQLTDLYATQSRMEDEMAARLDLVDRLRAQIQELERDKRDSTKRYNEQTATFEAERQSFYDNEQHLKSRIQSLSVQIKSAPPLAVSTSEDTASIYSEADETTTDTEPQQRTPTHTSFGTDEDDEPPEMSALRLELSTLSTSYTSLQTTVQHLSHQLLDLQRVNKTLQEDNESYNILLRERTLSGQYDILRAVGTAHSDEDSDRDDAFSKDDKDTVSIERSSLEPVDELSEEFDGEDHEVVFDELEDHDHEEESPSTPSTRERPRRHGRVRNVKSRSRSPGARGETLADLPITGPGLDLAAELGRAENLAILEGRLDAADAKDRSVLNGKKKKRPEPIETSVSKTDTLAEFGGDIDALRNEVKSLKDANKALSLYASKIIDRIIAQEGFEHVLAVDYEKPTDPNSPVKAKSAGLPPPSPEKLKKTRPQSAIFARVLPATANLEASPSLSSSPPIPSETTSTSKTQRRSMSFDWKSFSVFGGGVDKKPEGNSSLKPLTLRPGGPSAVGVARKLETQEDEEDKKERERMNAVLKLMGIDKPESPMLPSSPPANGVVSPNMSVSPPLSISPEPRPAVASRFSFFRSRSSTMGASTTSSLHSTSAQSSANVSSNNLPSQNLTKEALEQAEVQANPSRHWMPRRGL